MDVPAGIIKKMRVIARRTLVGASAAAFTTIHDLTQNVAPERLRAVKSSYAKTTRAAALGVRLVHAPGTRWQDSEDSKANRATLYISNHSSFVDPVLLLELTNGATIVGAHWAADLARVGKVVRRCAILIEEGHTLQKVVALRQIRAALAAGGEIAIFPEGEMYSGDRVREFRRGAFIAARGLDVDVVPVGLAYDSEEATHHPGDEYIPAHVLRLLARRSTTVCAAIGARQPLRSIRDPESAIHRQVQDLVHAARAHLDSLSLESSQSTRLGWAL